VQDNAFVADLKGKTARSRVAAGLTDQVCLSANGRFELDAVRLRHGKVEAIEAHHLIPGRYEVMDKLLLAVGTAVDLGEGAELGIRTEDQIDSRARPLQFTGFTIAPFKDILDI
jgi:hypothetical protein